jgi:uncharacterized protein (UPF0261 family)
MMVSWLYVRCQDTEFLGFAMKKQIALISTMDTKAPEVTFMAELIKQRGHYPLLIDVGPLSASDGVADYTNKDVAAAAGADLAKLLENPRDKIMATMAIGAKKILLKLYAEGKLDGVIGIGGNQGSSISATAMRSLPIGFPKYLVSTIASGNIRPYIAYTDIAVTFSIADLVGGPNPVSRSVLANAVAATIGMAESGEQVKSSQPEKTIALTALGNTEASANRIFQTLRTLGYEVITFHASGAGGSAMEELIEQGVFGGLVDLTPHEIAEEIAGVGSYVPIRSERMSAAGKQGIPQVISLGGLEYYCAGTRESLPPSHRRRKIYMHNPLNANVKLTHIEMAATAELMAERLNKAKGPVRILVPLRGWSVYGAKGGPFYDLRANAIFLRTLYGKLNTHKVAVQEVDAHINDEAFADICAAAIHNNMKRT